MPAATIPWLPWKGRSAGRDSRITSATGLLDIRRELMSSPSRIAERPSQRQEACQISLWVRFSCWTSSTKAAIRGKSGTAHQTLGRVFARIQRRAVLSARTVLVVAACALARSNNPSSSLLLRARVLRFLLGFTCRIGGLDSFPKRGLRRRP